MILNNCGDRDDVTMYYPVMNVTQCEGQLSTYHLNGGSMTTPQSEEKNIYIYFFKTLYNTTLNNLI